jgi:hypothetical protein
MNAEPTSTVEERLADLEAASDQRRRDLYAVLDALPAAQSRRAMLQALGTDLRHAPNKGDIAARAARKLGRAPRALLYRARVRVRQLVSR